MAALETRPSQRRPKRPASRSLSDQAERSGTAMASLRSTAVSPQCQSLSSRLRGRRLGLLRSRCLLLRGFLIRAICLWISNSMFRINIQISTRGIDRKRIRDTTPLQAPTATSQSRRWKSSASLPPRRPIAAANPLPSKPSTDSSKTRDTPQHSKSPRQAQPSSSRSPPRSSPPFFHFGALSVRLFYWRVHEVVESYGKGASTPPASLIGQVLFRDMYFAAQAALGQSFAQTATNAYCRFIPWHLPSKRDPETGFTTGDYHIDKPEAEEWFQRWKAGVTGFPWIDALMRQLKQEGWIHHLGRHSLACFLTRGGCYVDWERGAEVFEELLIDHEPACNIGNWQWLACVAFFAQYYRCYSPVSFGQKWDKNGDFIRRWVPELKKVKAKYIYEPWKMPLVDQKQAGVRVTGGGLSERQEGSYPKPMFDFDERRSICLSAMKNAYAVGLHGNDEKVLDGSWRSLFPSPDEAEVMGEYESDYGETADIGDEEEDQEELNGDSAGIKRAARKNSADAKTKKQKT
ncbi:uncharacterized protein TrAtP1_008155 [Trichoderma atroviride]|uniref:uncharacterized protein n=1 Tax=Hypocrea atroviridis TaxID=63577 RepID=UPI00332D13A8|nr:hypothetical protein TrAtP1_008155 [Trichoderma atroviride]